MALPTNRYPHYQSLRKTISTDTKAQNHTTPLNTCLYQSNSMSISTTTST